MNYLLNYKMEVNMNKGGFSWKRLLGITRAKQRLSRQIGIPLTKSGRERKLGALIMGKGYFVILATLSVMLTILVLIITY
jgi:hypothetical protein